MNKAYTRINWENEPAVTTPLNATNLNKIDGAVNILDDRIIVLDTSKAAQSDLLLCVKEITFNSTTGVLAFVWQNNTTLSVDLNIEKIPVSFSMDENGVITMTTADGTEYTCDVSTMMKEYHFNDSDQIDFTSTLQQDGSYNVTGIIKSGSILSTMLDSSIMSNINLAVSQAQGYASSASGSADDAAESAQSVSGVVEDATEQATLSESWAVGGTNSRQGENTNNAWYWALQAQSASGGINKEIVTVLPTTNISTDTIYLVLKETAETDDIYNEYLNIDGTTSGWEFLGSTAIDLTNYYTKSEANGMFALITNTGNKANLTTTAKNNLVAAINEVNAKPSGGGSASETTYNNTASGMTATNVQDAVDELNDSLLASGEHFYYDVKDGVRGYNTEAARGADTFRPFKFGYTIPTWKITSAGGADYGAPGDRLILDVSGYNTVTIGDIVQGASVTFHYIRINDINYTSIASVPRTIDVSNVDTLTIGIFIQMPGGLGLLFTDITVS